MTQLLEVVVEHFVDQLGDARAAGPRHHDIDLLLDDVERVVDGRRCVAQFQEGFVIFRIADADGVVRRQAQFRRGQPSSRWLC